MRRNISYLGLGAIQFDWGERREIKVESQQLVELLDLMLAPSSEGFEVSILVAGARVPIDEAAQIWCGPEFPVVLSVQAPAAHGETKRPTFTGAFRVCFVMPNGCGKQGAHGWVMRTTAETETVLMECYRCGYARRPYMDERRIFGPVVVPFNGEEVSVTVESERPFLPNKLWLPKTCKNMIVKQISVEQLCVESVWFSAIDILVPGANAPVEMFTWISTFPDIAWPVLDAVHAVRFRLLGGPPSGGVFRGAFYAPRSRSDAN